MAKVANMKGKWYVQGAKGWLDEKGEAAVVHAEHGTKFYADEASATKDGYKVPAPPKV